MIALLAAIELMRLETGNELIAACKADSPVCGGYAIGAVDAFSLDDAAGGGRRSFCMDAGVTGGQIKEIFSRYLNNHPEQLHWSGALLAMNAMREAFPCRAK